jgi:hypothetical protein
VLVAGGNPTRGVYDPHLEVYSPAYLFNADGGAAARPAITNVTPSAIGYGANFQIATPDGNSISSVVLIRAGAVTHSFDMDQRLVGMSFSNQRTTLTVTSPPNSNIAPRVITCYSFSIKTAYPRWVVSYSSHSSSALASALPRHKEDSLSTTNSHYQCNLVAVWYRLRA